MKEYVCHMHCHSLYSDGSGTVNQIVDAAQQAGLDVIILTDHNTLRAKSNEGWHGKSLLLVGMEIGFARKNHYLAYDVHECIDEFQEERRSRIDAVRKQGGLGFIAHPYDMSSPFVEEGKTFEWTDWGVDGFTGIEIWNYMSDWQISVQGWLSGLYATLFPDSVLDGPDPRTLARWDERTRHRRVVAIGGSDAHARDFRVCPGITFNHFPYEFLFRGINTHVLSENSFNGNLAHDERIVYDALRAGHCFVAHDGIGESKGFRFSAENTLEDAVIGDELLYHWARAQVSVPETGVIRLLRYGALVKEAEGTALETLLDRPGAYRVEVYKKKGKRLRPWIFSNPIYI